MSQFLFFVIAHQQSSVGSLSLFHSSSSTPGHSAGEREREERIKNDLTLSADGRWPQRWLSSLYPPLFLRVMTWPSVDLPISITCYHQFCNENKQKIDVYSLTFDILPFLTAWKLDEGN